MEDRLWPLAEHFALTRRSFLQLAALSTAAIATGCATDPITGRSQLMLVSEETEIQVDQQNSPHQFSSDYGAVQDAQLNGYIQQVGQRITVLSHRPHMPYSLRVVNATYINAYAFPGGSIAVTRGILVKLDDEAELASLLGHEIGHVNARHTAEQMSKGMLSQAVVGGLSTVAGTQSPALGQLTSSLGMMGAGALLASYSRENEREADALGMEYMVRAGYGSDGFVGLMEMLQSLSNHKLSSAQLLFATHPMSQERYQNAVRASQQRYAKAKAQPLFRERYMDRTAQLRAMQEALDEMQAGEKAMGLEKYSEAEEHFTQALKQAPQDYAALAMMSKCQLAQKQYAEARTYAEIAQQVYPQEAQANHLAGFAKIRLKQFEAAYQDFSRYDQLLPGNPNMLFFKGYCREGMQQVQQAAELYHRYLQVVQQGPLAKHAYSRLVQWGYVKG